MHDSQPANPYASPAPPPAEVAAAVPVEIIPEPARRPWGFWATLGWATLAGVARHLNDEGFRPPKRAEKFNDGIVAGFLAKGGRSGPRPRVLNAGGLLQEGEWLLSDLARELHMPMATLHRWRRVGWIHSRKLPVPGGHWAIWADRTELKRMTRLRRFRRSWLVKAPPPDLTTPGPRDDQ